MKLPSIIRKSTDSGKTNRSRSRRVLAVVLFAAAAIVAGSTFGQAAFTTNSQPWADGTTGKATSVTATATIEADLYPGNAENVEIKIKNPNPVPVKVTSVSHTGFKAEDTRLLDFLVNTLNDNPVVGTVVQPGQTKTLVLKNAVGLKPETDDARQNAKFQSGYFVAYQLLPGSEVS